MRPLLAAGLLYFLTRGAAAQNPVVYSLKGASEFERFGISLAALGDIDGDGAPDFVAGADKDEPEDAATRTWFRGNRGRSFAPGGEKSRGFILAR